MQMCSFQRERERYSPRSECGLNQDIFNTNVTGGGLLPAGRGGLRREVCGGWGLKLSKHMELQGKEEGTQKAEAGEAELGL